MKEYTLSEQFALIGLDGQDSLHGTLEKGVAVRGIAAAKLLESLFLEEKEENSVFRTELGKGIAGVKRIRGKAARALEKEMADSLFREGSLEEAPDLLGCDMNYYTASVSMKVYRSDERVWTGITERVRAEILEEGAVTAECVALLWLFRETGCLHEIFSVREQELLERRMKDICVENERYDILWSQEFHNSLDTVVKNFLWGRKSFFKNPYMKGVNLLFPFLNRRQAIFIDFVIFGTNVKQRRAEVAGFLRERGHHVEEVRQGEETLLKIDNMYYRVWPKTITVQRVPVQGANLLPVYR